jgi:hypothetical protein
MEGGILIASAGVGGSLWVILDGFPSLQWSRPVHF